VRLLFLNAIGAVGGAERVLLDLLASLRRAEPNAELHLAAGTDGPLLSAAESRGARATLLPMPAGLVGVGDSALRGLGKARAALRLLGKAAAAGAGAWRYARALRRLTAQLRPDVIHSNSLKTHLLAALAGSPAPLVWHLHDFLGARPVAGKLLKLAARRVRGAVAISEAVAADARPLLGRLPVAVVANAVDVDHFSPRPAEGDWLDGLAGLPPAPAGAVRVGLVATYARWKGQDVFLKAAARLGATVGDRPLRYFIIGGPIYRTAGSQWSEAELRTQAEALGLAGRVGFVGYQADPARVYRGLDVVVHASTLPEPFGLTVVEAMACGRAVVVSRAGGAAELFTPEADALGTPPGDDAALAEAVRRLADDDGLRERLGAAARQTAVERFHRDRLGSQVIAAYRQFGIPG
jgi:glycosyltransferase involved in cell wall biosynthesis